MLQKARRRRHSVFIFGWSGGLKFWTKFLKKFFFFFDSFPKSQEKGWVLLTLFQNHKIGVCFINSFSKLQKKDAFFEWDIFETMKKKGEIFSFIPGYPRYSQGRPHLAHPRQYQRPHRQESHHQSHYHVFPTSFYWILPRNPPHRSWRIRYAAGKAAASSLATFPLTWTCR